MNTLTDKRDRVIKSFYTPFNFLKAIRYNDKEGIIFKVNGNAISPGTTVPSGTKIEIHFFFFF